MYSGEEIYKAYADWHMKDFEKALTIRNLDYLGKPGELDEVHTAFLKACQHYNNFDTDKVFIKLKKICQAYNVTISPAREGSPALYLHCENEKDMQEIFNKLKKEKSLYIDELNIRHNSTIRMWWD